MSFPKYPHYKDSGVESLGELPEHWDRAPLKHTVRIRITDGPHETPVFLDEGIPFLSAEAVKKGKLDFDKKRGFISQALHQEYTKKCQPKRNDVLMVKSGNTTGAIAIVETDEVFSIWSPLALIRVNPKMMNARFIYHSLQADFFQKSVALSCSYGTQPNIGMGVIENLFVSVPSLSEQELIAKFLDRETAKIDTLIAKQERLIELLQEKRQALISHAVTKGLNPDAPMKDSGIEWLGAIPAHWEVKRFGVISQIVRGASPRPAGDPKYFGGNFIPWVTVAEITKDDSKFLTETETGLTEEGASQSRLIKKGTLLLTNSGATLGVPKILEVDACANDGVLAFLNVSETCDQNFLFYFLYALTGMFRERIKQGSGQPNLNTDIVKATGVTVPSKEEQTEIVRYIEQILARFDSLLSKANKTIALLQEHRIALISAAVTGKIDVRETASRAEAAALS